MFIYEGRKHTLTLQSVTLKSVRARTLPPSLPLVLLGARLVVEASFAGGNDWLDVRFVLGCCCTASINCRVKTCVLSHYHNVKCAVKKTWESVCGKLTLQLRILCIRATRIM